MSSAEYHPETLETEIQSSWLSIRHFRFRLIRHRKVLLPGDVPYPSGKLHMGHVRNYTIADVIARYLANARKERTSTHGLGRLWFACRERRHSAESGTRDVDKGNIAEMRKQLQRLGFAYDWDRELATCSPEYYRWEQWFYRLYEKGLVYKKMALLTGTL